MKAHVWRQPPDIGNLPGWEGEAGPLLGWARWTVDSLHYLADLDAAVVVEESADGHAWHVIDLAHARWAAASAVGAVDLCAAALSRRIGVGPKETRRGDREFDLCDLVQAVKAGTVTGAAAAWATPTNGNADLQLLTAIRHPTTHARLKRKFFRGGGSGDRTFLLVEDIGGAPIMVGDVVTLARDTATTIVEDFFDKVASAAF